MADELKIVIKKDSKGNEPSLSNITIEAAEALKSFIDSLTKLAHQYDDAAEFKISLTPGSVASSLIPPSTQSKFSEDLDQIIYGRSNDNRKIKLLKDIQDKIKLNGLQYEVTWSANNKTDDVTHIFKGKNFSKRRNKIDLKIDKVFIKGKLFEAGGKVNSNIHLEDGIEDFTVECSQEEAIEINRNLYKEIYISTVRTQRRGQKTRYLLCNIFKNLEIWAEHKLFHAQILNEEGLKKFDLVHEKLVQEIEREVDSIYSLNKILKEYNNGFTERGIIRTILMSLKPVIKKEEFRGITSNYKLLAETLRSGSTNNTI